MKKALIKTVPYSRLEQLLAIAGALHTEKDISALLRLIAHSAAEFMDAEVCRIVLSARKGPEQTILAEPGAAKKPDNSLSALLVPIRVGEANVGSLEILRSSSPYRVDDLSLFQSFADLCTVALDNARLHLELSDKITALQTRTRELTEAQDKLADSEKLALAGRLAASVSHEIRNLLTPIRLIASDPPKEGPLDALDAQGIRHEYHIIEEQVDKATAMAQGFLSFSRQGTAEKKPLDINTIVTKTLDLIHHRFKSGRVTLRTELAPDLPSVNTNAIQLEQVLLNLVKNAEDALKERENGVIIVSTSIKKTRLLLKISDNGTGIKPEHLEKMCQPFFTTKADGEGTGLGLTVCRHIVTQHQGEFRVESEWGKGTTMVIDLPVFQG